MSEKRCGDCKYFLSYYLIVRSYLRKTACGLCGCSDIPWKKRKSKKETDSACEYWESNEQADGEQKDHIQAALLKITKRIEEIAMILKSDE